jgi:hypothetical protein
MWYTKVLLEHLWWPTLRSSQWGQLKTSSLYHDLHTSWILQEPEMTIQGVKITPYLIGHSTYPLRTYLTKNWKSHNSNDVNKKRYDSSMNFARVIIKNVFGSWKNNWWTLKNFNFSVNKALAIAVSLLCVTQLL